MKKQFCLLVLFFAFTITLFANPRIKFSINENWRFTLEDISTAKLIDCNDADWLLVNFPHTWNAVDALDETSGYHRGIAWYRRSINIPTDYSDKMISIFFEGANQEVELYVNGKMAGIHKGGYTRFSFDVTPFLRCGESNVFSIKVDNSYNINIPPLTADFTFFGGIHRDVYLLITNKQQITTTHFASDGVYIRTPKVSAENALIQIQTLLDNASDVKKALRVEHTLLDANKKVVQIVSAEIKLNKQAKHDINQQTISLKNPDLWSPEKPSLYSIYTRIYDSKTKMLLDEVFQPLGIRWFDFSADNGFMLNGKSYKLIGTNRHQNYEAMGYALPDEIHVSDLILLKNMGANFLRISHYPQDPVIMEMCDKLGIISSVEIPIVNAITENEEFTENCLNMAREMVFQDYNRPSVLIWAYMNEVLLRLPFKGDSIRKKQYFESVNVLATKIENQIRQDDPDRSTMIPLHGSFNDYFESGLTYIPKIIGWNLYQGWYGGKFENFEEFLNNAHKKLPGIPFIVSEYGADVDARLHSFDPSRFDYTQEYANIYHEHYIKQIMDRKYVVGAAIWNLSDFYSEGRENAVPHVNNKGITTLKRELKDTYLHYQAMFSSKPTVNIGGQIWKIRGGNADEKNTCIQPIKVYSNFKEVELWQNGVFLGKKQPENNIAEFDFPFIDGENVIEAVGVSGNKPVRDMQKIDFRMIPFNLKANTQSFKEINVMMGSNRYFEDKTNSTIWIPEKDYSAGSWGFVGGKKYAKPTRYGTQPASDSDIMGTSVDPIFQTMRIGLKSFNMDVPDGEYTVSLYFAELQFSDKTKSLAYNLGNDAINEKVEQRIFNVSINDTKVLNSFNIAQEFGADRAVVKKFIVNTSGGKGLIVSFDALKGEAILNAIRVYRNY